MHAQTSTLLGPAFALGVIPDAMSAPRPSVFDTCLQGLSKKSPQEMHRTQETLRTVMHTIYSMLHTISMNFLKSQVNLLSRAIPDAGCAVRRNLSAHSTFNLLIANVVSRAHCMLCLLDVHAFLLDVTQGPKTLAPEWRHRLS